MKRLSALFLAGLLAAPAAFAQEQHPVVVELFTSQGCSSCPPADAILHELAQRDDVLPLALHVDYWDYIGWKDQFADPAHTKRQKAYAQTAGRNMIYTPQMIVMGQEDVVGADAAAVMDLVAKHQKATAPVDISTQRSGDKLHITLRPTSGKNSKGYSVLLVRYAPLKTIEITRGELAGRRMTYANVVEELRVLGTWDGREDTSLSVPVISGLDAAILVQRPDHGAIVAARRLD